MKMNRIFLMLLLLTGIFVSGFTSASANQVTIGKLELNIWPEYDRPQTLVILKITLTSDTRLPARISLRIPREAGSPYNVAVKDPDGLQYTVEYTLVPEGDWNRVEVTTSSAELQMEYYDPNLIIEGTLHSLSYHWIGDYPINDLTVVVQQPRGAYNININPSLGTGTLNPDDQLVYFRSSVGSLQSGEGFDLSLNYQKESDSLSATTLSVKPLGQFPVPNTLANQFQALIDAVQHDRGLLISAILILAFLVLFLIVVWLSGLPIFDRRRRLQRAVGETRDGKSAPPKYCPQCGKKAISGDIYCRVCGNKLPV